MTKVEQGKALFTEGYNCAQSVFLVFSDELGLDRETALKISSSFGGGMGRLREVCGTVSGMFMAEGLKNGYSNPTDTTAKAEHYKRLQALAATFKQENGSIICRELLQLQSAPSDPTPDPRTKEYYKKRPCVELVGDAIRILEDSWK